jgi:hypothetical protein
MQTLKVLTTRLLTTLNMKSTLGIKNRSLNENFLIAVDPEGLHVVADTFLHNDNEIRMTILAKTCDTMVPAIVYLDVDIEDYNLIPTIEV